MKEFIMVLKFWVWWIVLLFTSTHIFTKPTDLYWLVFIVTALISLFMAIN